MNAETNSYGNSKQQAGEDPGNSGAAAQSTQERDAEANGQAEQVARDVFDKTAKVASETSERVKSYSGKNPGKTILVALGIGVGLGLFLGARSRRPRSSRIAKPVIHALSDIALGYFR